MSIVKKLKAVGRRNEAMTNQPTVQNREPQVPGEIAQIVDQANLFDANDMWPMWQQANAELAHARSVNEKQAIQIAKLRAKLGKQNKVLMSLLESVNKQNNLIKKYKIKCAAAKKLLSTTPLQSAQVSTNIGPILSQLPSHTSTTVNDLQPQIISKPNQPTANLEENVRAMETLNKLKCPDCSYIAKKKTR